MDRVDFWACDATCLPFRDAGFSLAASLNVLDCVQSPYDHMKELARVLIHGIIHLFGYEHEKGKKESLRMMKKENYYLSKFFKLK